MIISPISSVTTSLTTPALQAASAINLGTINPLSPAISSNPGLLDAIHSNNITVDVSALGELLAYTARLQSRRTANVSTNGSTTNTVTQADATQTKADIAQLTAIATSLVDTFNQLQASNSNLAENPLIPSSSDSLLQAMNAGAQNADGSSLFEQLGKIGINLQNLAQPDSNSFLTLDVNAFQNALTENPAGTTSLLTQALQVLGSAESTLIAQNQELASGNLLATTGSTDTENTDVTNPASSTDTNSNSISNVSNNNASVNVNEDAVTATTTADAQLQQALGDEALRTAIDTTRNTQAAVISADSANDAVSNSQLTPAISASSETTTTETLAPNNATTNSQINSQVSAALNPTIDTSADATANITSAITSATATDIASNTTLNTKAPDQESSTNVSATASGASAGSNTSALSTATEAPEITVAASSLPLNSQTTAQTNIQAPPAASVDTPTTIEASIANANKLAANPAVPSSLLTESQLENQVAANSIKLNESAASNTASTNAKTVPNNSSTFAEVSKTLDTINQATTAANKLAANNPPLPSSPVSTTVAAPVASNASTLQTTPVNNNAIINTSASGTGIQASINPLISAAVAAFRVRDGLQANTTEKPRSAETDAVTAPEAVTLVEPVTLDLHEHAQNQRHDAEADSAYHQAKELGEPEKDSDAAGDINVKV
ncbi:hypothetical protein ACO0LD_19370 [Undibacterium sp. Ji83W]|uniref:hypothetical protein n=1 Tax=Undibacterium sp. Ji83W TaxID=3413043 RepID=UPI003BF43156